MKWYVAIERLMREKHKIKKNPKNNAALLAKKTTSGFAIRSLSNISDIVVHIWGSAVRVCCGYIKCTMHAFTFYTIPHKLIRMIHAKSVRMSNAHHGVCLCM